MSEPLPIGRPIRRRYGRRLFGVAALALAAVWLLSQHDLKYFKVTSGSMEPTLAIGARVEVDLAARTPHVGDIVAFHPPAGADPQTPVCAAPGQGSGYTEACALGTPQESRTVFIKRVVAGPGDTIAIVGGHAIRNGRTEADPYIASCTAGSSCTFPTALTLASGEYYMLGDNRGVSDDSRFWGPVPAAWIIGTVVRCSMLGAVCHPFRG